MCDLALLENTIIAVSAALIGTGIGYLLNRWSADRASREERGRRQRQALTILLMGISDIVDAARRLPPAVSELTDPASQLEVQETPIQFETLVKLFMDLPPELADPFTEVLKHVTALQEFMRVARARAARILGAPAPPLFEKVRGWTASDNSDPEFSHTYDRILAERGMLARAFESLEKAVTKAVPAGSVFA